MDMRETGGWSGGADEENLSAAEDLHDYLGGVHFIVGEGTGVAHPWPSDRATGGRKASGASLEVMDHVELGRLVADWAADPASRPADVAELASQLRGVATLPEDIRTIRFVEDAPGELTIRLPAVDRLEADLADLTDPMRESGCPLPAFYVDQHRPGIGQMLTPVDMFLSRLGDVALGKP